MMNFQDIVLALKEFWSQKGCLLIEPYDVEKGAATFNPATFFGAISSSPVQIAYPEPCRRPADGRYGDNPNRLGKYYQFQVLLKPVPHDVTDLYIDSLKSLGLDVKKHDLRWIEDDWESPTLGAAGLGWEVWLDGMEITQFTYFQQMGQAPLFPVSVEITYGLERIAMYLQKKDSVFDLQFNSDTSYGEMFKEAERQFSVYNFEEADVEMLARHFEDYEKEGERLVSKGLPLPAYDCVLKLSHCFNVLEARGAVSVTERAQYIARVRGLAKKVITCYRELENVQKKELTHQR